MKYESEFYCPECDSGLDAPASRRWQQQTRREFLGKLGAAGGVAAVAGATPILWADDAPAKTRTAKPAEALIRELHASLSDAQKKQLVLPWNHRRGKAGLSRLGTYNSAIMGKRLADHLTKSQQDLVKRTVKSILSGDEAWERITRHGKWDNSGSFERTGCAIFGEPRDGKKFAWVFSGHHLTLRCDGNSEPGAAFGGPMYYGHTARGYSKKNVYYYQTRQVQEVYDTLNKEQRKLAVSKGDPGDREKAIKFRKSGEARPGIAYSALGEDQQKLVAGVMRTLLEPFRKADGDEVMQIVKQKGGMEKIHLAFYQDKPTKGQTQWDYWRLEGPGFIWNYRVLPHVHCYVNITSQPS